MRSRAAAAAAVLLFAWLAAASAQVVTAAYIGCAPASSGLNNLTGGAIVEFQYYSYALAPACLTSLLANSTANSL